MSTPVKSPAYKKSRAEDSAEISDEELSTDNKGNSFAISKLYTGRQPGAAILRHMAVRLMQTGGKMKVKWVPRDHNVWADDLSKGHTQGFHSSMRRNIDWSRYTLFFDEFSVVPSP